jgi:hypothetical protein
LGGQKFALVPLPWASVEVGVIDVTEAAAPTVARRVLLGRRACEAAGLVVVVEGGAQLFSGGRERGIAPADQQAAQWAMSDPLHLRAIQHAHRAARRTAVVDGPLKGQTFAVGVKVQVRLRVARGAVEVQRHIRAQPALQVEGVGEKRAVKHLRLVVDRQQQQVL